jgi:hypothetical protein
VSLLFYLCVLVKENNLLISAIVLVSVVGMAASNDLQAWIDRKFKKQSNQEQYNVVKT